MVTTETADHHVVAITDVDDIRAADIRSNRVNGGKNTAAVEGGIATVADHHILVGSTGDRVSSKTADNAVATAAHRNDVVATDCFTGADDLS